MSKPEPFRVVPVRKAKKRFAWRTIEAHTRPVTARLLEGEERAEVWKTALAFWPPYATYQKRIEREIRLFRIIRRAGGGPPE